MGTKLKSRNQQARELAERDAAAEAVTKAAEAATKAAEAATKVNTTTEITAAITAANAATAKATLATAAAIAAVKRKKQLEALCFFFSHPTTESAAGSALFFSGVVLTLLAEKELLLVNGSISHDVILIMGIALIVFGVLVLAHAKKCENERLHIAQKSISDQINIKMPTVRMFSSILCFSAATLGTLLLTNACVVPGLNAQAMNVHDPMILGVFLLFFAGAAAFYFSIKSKHNSQAIETDNPVYDVTMPSAST